MQEFTANYTEGVYRLDMGSGLVVRRVRIQVGNFTTRPCFRWELIGCEARMYSFVLVTNQLRTVWGFSCVKWCC